MEHNILTENQEKSLVTWILRQESLGYAPTYGQLRGIVLGNLTRQNPTQPQTLGRKC
jgi:hypothetical protein